MFHKTALLCFLLFHSLYIGAQKITLKIEGTSPLETQTIDSIGYQELHLDLKSISAQLEQLEDQLQQSGFLQWEKVQLPAADPSLYQTTYALGPRISKTQFTTSDWPIDVKASLHMTSDTLVVPFSQTQAQLQTWLHQLAQLGYNTSVITPRLQGVKAGVFYSQLQLQLHSKRKLDRIEITSASKVPKKLLHSILQSHLNTPLTQETLKGIDRDLSPLPFVKQSKASEILFTTDSTAVYLFVEPLQANRFDGFVGFGTNEENKLLFNGYLDLKLVNSLQRGETFELLWKNDGNQQSHFKLKAEIPYLFQTPLALAAQIDIHKQDSSFQNTKINLELGYYINYNSRAFIGYQSRSSASDQQTAIQQNYDSRFATLSYQLTHSKPENLLFPEQFDLKARVGLGQLNLDNANKARQFIELEALKNFVLNAKNSLFVQWKLNSLLGEGLLTNELSSFGGIHSIRGFRENSLRANFYTHINTEYRYQLAPSLYIHSILDYGKLENKTANYQSTLFAVGLGIGMLTKTGKLQLIYANGKAQDSPFDLKNALIHLSLSSYF